MALAGQGVLVGLLTGIAGVGGGAIGVIIGQRLAPHLPELRLRQGFSALLIGSALLTGFEAWERHHRPLAALRAAASRQVAPFPSGSVRPFSSSSPMPAFFLVLCLCGVGG
jgi:hypothetical protein